MGIRRKPWTEAYISRLEREGKGRGEGHHYRPWATVQSFSSIGTQSRIPNTAVGSTVHVMSNIERTMFLLHEHKPGLVDYRAQFAIPREVTLAAAHALSIRHPVYPRTTIPVVMTFDALVTREMANNELVTSAWDAKLQADLEKPRVRAKLSLHRAACTILGISHYVFTEKSVDRTTVKNIQWLRSARQRVGECEVELEILNSHKPAILADLYHRRPSKSIDAYCTEYDRMNGLGPGTALRAVKQLISEHVLDVDLSSADIVSLRVPTPRSPLLPVGS